MTPNDADRAAGRAFGRGLSYVRGNFFGRAALGLVTMGSLLVAGSARADDGLGTADEAVRREARESIMRADASVATMEKTASHLRHLLMSARERNATTEMRCVDVSLTRANVALRYGRAHRDRLVSAWSDGRVQSARFESVVLGARLAASLDARRVAEACTAADIGLTPGGITRVRVIVDPDLVRRHDL